MFRTSDTVLIAVMVAAAAFTYKTKHDAEGSLREVRKLESQIRYQEDMITVINADWALLTQPARLQRLSEHFTAQLNLQPQDPRQIVSARDVPEKQLVIEDLIGAAEPVGKDKIKTGSTKP